MPLSAKQMEYLAIAWQCFETEPKIDYTKFANVANLASAHSARELMRVTKNKLKSEYGALGASLSAANANGNGTSTPTKGNGTPTKKTPAKAAGTPRAGTPKTPKTVTEGSRKRGPSGKKKAQSEVEEAVNGANGGEEGSSGGSLDELEDESPSKKIKKTNGVKAEAHVVEEGGFFAEDGLFQ